MVEYESVYKINFYIRTLASVFFWLTSFVSRHVCYIDFSNNKPFNIKGHFMKNSIILHTMVGVLFVVGASAKATTSADIQNSAEDVEVRVTRAAQDVMRETKHAARKTAETIKNGAHTASEKTKEVATKAGEAVKHAAQVAVAKTKEVATNVGHSIEEGAQAVAGTVKEKAHEAKDAIKRTVHDGARKVVKETE
jgi:ElaB/YqjD/DUF883 family membrane-anchored ribosome-binding protein